MVAINVNHVKKAYKRYPSKWARAREWITGRQCHSKTWILRDINFRVAPGEAVGIVGANGAGKSTLLKIIAGTTQPSLGNVAVNGRLAALLELGMGFHPDFTGRQNALIAGQLIGLKPQELLHFMPAIEAFAEIGDYIDRPVRLYSSGMQMRLAFSLATALRPEVLIVDEALSVGDAYFQHKSFDRIRRFRAAGTALLIVSHDKNAIHNLCDRALLLEDGFIIKDGKPDEVMDLYNAIIADRERLTIAVKPTPSGNSSTISGTGEARVAAVTLLGHDGQPTESIRVGEQVRLNVEIRIYEDLPELSFGYMIKDRLGQAIFGTNTYQLGIHLGSLMNGERRTLSIAFRATLGTGSYSISTALHTADNHLRSNYEWRDLALIFNVINTEQHEFTGVCWIPPRFTVIS